ncbi:MAG: hypothetical protein OER90_12340 [Gemmatimonadota bacterium]|nr:hypothetical protein [Gemmatimonadota bacterium]
MNRMLKLSLTLVLTAAILVPASVEAQRADRAKIQEAMKAAPDNLARNATIMDWDQSVLREGTNGWTCMPTPPDLPGTAPMCLDAQWVNWAHAWQTKTTPTFTSIGISYMLEGDEGASNSDPYGTKETSTDWVVAGPHLMIVLPDPSMLDDMTTDHTTGGPWVMWQGTPYAHIMVPLK